MDANNGCSAYPDGIPSTIFVGLHDHRNEFGGEEKDENNNTILYKSDSKDLESLMRKL